MIKVAEEYDLETEQPIDDICELVEICCNENGECDGFIKPSITSLECLYKAFAEVANEGVNTWFWENGRFSCPTKKSTGLGKSTRKARFTDKKQDYR